MTNKGVDRRRLSSYDGNMLKRLVHNAFHGALNLLLLGAHAWCPNPEHGSRHMDYHILFGAECMACRQEQDQ